MTGYMPFSTEDWRLWLSELDGSNAQQAILPMAPATLICMGPLALQRLLGLAELALGLRLLRPVS